MPIMHPTNRSTTEPIYVQEEQNEVISQNLTRINKQIPKLVVVQEQIVKVKYA